MRHRITQPLLSSLFKKIGRKLGVKVFVEKEWGVVGQIAYPNGRNRYFRGTTLDINTMAASALAVDKDYSKIFMTRMGYEVIPWKKFYSNAWARRLGSLETIERAWTYAQKIGLPVFVKPNSKSQGTGVTKVYNKGEFFKAFRAVARVDQVILVEQAINGKDYRVVVLDDEVISAYERIPLAVVGDGKHSVSFLLRQKQREYVKAGREKTFLAEDFRLKLTLKREKFTLKSVLGKGVRLQMLANANLSTGGTSVDVTDSIHPLFRNLAIRLTKDMGLRLCGVDIMVVGGDISMPPKEYYVIEVNSAPGLDHYAAMGSKQAKIVERLYTKVFIAMGKD